WNILEAEIEAQADQRTEEGLEQTPRVKSSSRRGSGNAQPASNRALRRRFWAGCHCPTETQARWEAEEHQKTQDSGAEQT
ncbi:hypothetical protein P7K49_040297, partial [Saguinus oedipus]